MSVNAGYNYSGAVTAQGVVYTWGSGEFGRLGYTDVRRQTIPRQISDLKGQRIVKIALGYYHAAAINDQGMVFTWGRGITGQLGRGNIVNEDSVQPVSSLQSILITDVSCGESHTVALSTEGEVYTWGGGQLGQLGHGDFLRQSLPIKVTNFEDRICQISCGKRHTAAVSQEGFLYTWGSNEYGQLGRLVNTTKLILKKHNTQTGSTSAAGGSQNHGCSAKTSPSMNLQQTTHQFYN